MKFGPLSDAKVLGFVFDIFTKTTVITPIKPKIINTEIQTTGSRIRLYRSISHARVGVFSFAPNTVVWAWIVAGYGREILNWFLDVYYLDRHIAITSSYIEAISFIPPAPNSLRLIGPIWKSHLAALRFHVTDDFPILTAWFDRPWHLCVILGLARCSSLSGILAAAAQHRLPS